MGYEIRKCLIDGETTLKVNLACGGGVAISLKPASDADLKTVRPYGRSL